MSKRIEFYFDLGSPSAYLAYTQLPAIAAEAHAEIDWRPVLLGGILQASGNASPIQVPAKGRYLMTDLARFARRYGVELNFNPHFPINTLRLMRAVTGLQMHRPEEFLPCVDALYEAMWVDGRDLGDDAAVTEVLATAGLAPEGILELAERDDVKARLREQTEAAVARGLFGVPTMFVDDQMFFGQDRLDFVAQALENA